MTDHPFGRWPNGHSSTMAAFEMRLLPDLSLLASLRSALKVWLEGVGVADPRRSDIVLAAHEAAANAIEHAASLSPIEIHARRSLTSVVVEVRDHGRWRRIRSDEEGRGRGPTLIEGLVSAAKVESDDRGTTLRLLQRI